MEQSPDCNFICSTMQKSIREKTRKENEQKCFIDCDVHSEDSIKRRE